MEKEIQSLQQYVLNLLELKLEMIQQVDSLRREIATLSSNYETSMHWPVLLEDLHREVDDVNIEFSLGFIDDIEEQINDLTYKGRRAVEQMRTSVNPILKNTPVYFDAANPPDPADFAKPPEEF